MKKDYHYTDFLDAACQFSRDFELVCNRSDDGFIARRHHDFLREEYEEFTDALLMGDKCEMIDAACDVAFIALTQVYHILRWTGVEHHKAVAGVRIAMQRVCDTNLAKTPPTVAGKITKPEGWKKPEFGDLLAKGE